MMSSSVEPPHSHRPSPWGLLSLLSKVHSRKEAGLYGAVVGPAHRLGDHLNAGSVDAARTSAHCAFPVYLRRAPSPNIFPRPLAFPFPSS